MAPLMSCDPQMGLGFLLLAFLAILTGDTGALAGVLVGGGAVGGADGVISFIYSAVIAQIVVFFHGDHRDPHSAAGFARIEEPWLI